MTENLKNRYSKGREHALGNDQLENGEPSEEVKIEAKE
jgi:hypothetical protein